MKTDKINPSYFDWTVKNNIATICLSRPDKKNPLTFDSYAELRDTFIKLKSTRPTAVNLDWALKFFRNSSRNNN